MTAVLLLIIAIIFYLVVGIALSIGADYPALVTVFWLPLLMIALVMETLEFAKDRFEEIQEWLEDKADKIGGK